MRNPPFNPGEFYHIFNRANGVEKMFFRKPNYDYFLNCYIKKMMPFVTTIAYCLMPNHFHFIVKIRSQAELMRLIPKFLFERPDISAYDIFSNEIQRKLQGWIGGYAQAINKQEKRLGSLFMHTTKRKHIHNADYLKKAIIYVHQNPIRAGLTHDWDGWAYSSFNQFLEDTGIVDNRTLLQTFGGATEFFEMHQSVEKQKYPEELDIPFAVGI